MISSFGSLVFCLLTQDYDSNSEHARESNLIAFADADPSHSTLTASAAGRGNVPLFVPGLSILRIMNNQTLKVRRVSVRHYYIAQYAICSTEYLNDVYASCSNQCLQQTIQGPCRYKRDNRLPVYEAQTNSGEPIVFRTALMWRLEKNSKFWNWRPHLSYFAQIFTECLRISFFTQTTTTSMLAGFPRWVQSFSHDSQVHAIVVYGLRRCEQVRKKAP